MKKYFLPTILFFIFLWPISLESSQLFVKMNFGLFQAEKVDDVWRSTTNSYDFKNIQGEQVALQLDLSLEFIYQLNPNISFSFGTGYFSRNFNGKGRFTAPDTSGFTGYFFISPEVKSNIYSFYLSSIFSFSIIQTIQWNFLGGVGYYFGHIECKKVFWDPEFFDPSSQWRYFLWEFESNSSTVGFHAGSGIDIDLSLNMFLSAEVLYRMIYFKKFKSVPIEIYSFYGMEPDELGGDSTFLYAQGLEGMEYLGDIDYSFSNFNCSGFLIRIGLKFKF